MLVLGAMLLPKKTEMPSGKRGTIIISLHERRRAKLTNRFKRVIRMNERLTEFGLAGIVICLLAASATAAEQKQELPNECDAAEFFPAMRKLGAEPNVIGTQPLSVENRIASRRLLENYCLKRGHCVVDDPKNKQSDLRLRDLRRRELFSECMGELQRVFGKGS